MNTYEATMIAEGVEETDTPEEYYAAWQHLIDTGVCWQLQGFYGRTATQFINEGLCHPSGE